MPATVQYSDHAPGLPHAKDTVRKMAALAREGGHTFEIRNWATRVTHKVPSKQPLAELAALYVWVRENIRYRNDPYGLEWVQSPKRTLIELAGDCDDMAVLLGAGAIALGRPIRFEIAGPSPARFQHVYVQALVPDGRWVTLDPVLEPPATGKPRTDLGKFGHRVQGFRKRFDAEGSEMLSGPTSPRDRVLWQTVPYFPQVPPTSGYANPADAGRSPAPTRASTAYRSARVPGPTIPGPPSRSGVQPYSGLGHYTAIDNPCPGQVALGDNGELVVWDEQLGIWGFLKKVGKAVGSVVKVVTKIPGIDIAASLIPGGGTVLKYARTAGKMLRGGKKKRAVSRIKKRDVDAIKRRTRGGKGKGLRIASEVARELERRKKKRVVRGRGKKKRSKVVRRKRRRVTAKARRRPTRRPTRVIRKARPRVAAPPRKKRPSRKALRRRRRRRRLAAQKKPHPALRSKYPPDARQLWDPSVKRFRIFIPVAGGLGQLPIPLPVPFPPVAVVGPPLPFGQLPIPLPVPFPPVAITGPPLPFGQIPVPVPVPLPFLLGQSPLSISLNLLGAHPSGRHRHSVQLPTGEVVYTSFDGWLTSGHAVLGAAEPARLRAAAQAAVDAVAAHIRSRGDKRPPGRSVPAVLALQLLDPDVAAGGRPGGLDPDGLWGKNSRAAAGYYLNRAPSTLPPILPVFARGALTWTPAPAPVVVAPTPARAPVPPTPIRPPVTTPTRIRTRAPAVVVSKPPAPTRVITRPPVDVTTRAPAVVIQPAPRELETLTRYKAPPPAPVPTTFRVAPGVVTMPRATPARARRVDVTPLPDVPLRLPVTTGPVPPVPVAPPVNTTAAPPGQYPPGAVYRDASGTPRVSGYSEVAQETDNPGMDPVGMNPPPGVTLVTESPYGPGAVVQVDRRPTDNNWWLLLAFGFFAMRKKKAA